MENKKNPLQMVQKIRKKWKIKKKSLTNGSKNQKKMEHKKKNPLQIIQKIRKK